MFSLIPFEFEQLVQLLEFSIPIRSAKSLSPWSVKHSEQSLSILLIFSQMTHNVFVYGLLRGLSN